MQQSLKYASVLLGLAAMVVCVSSAHARTWVIKHDGTGDAPTIQAGIDSSAAGDTVLLEPGTYTGAGNHAISFNGKAVTVTSASGSGLTIVDCQNLDRAFMLHNGETSSSVLSHLTVVNGQSPTSGGWGGAVSCQGSSPIITHCVFRNNSAGSGGAVGCDNSGAEITFNEFDDNTATQGGAVASGFGESVGVLVDNNTFSGNSATSLGGAVYSFEASDVVSHNRFAGNNAGSRGGGVYHIYGNTTIEYNVLYLNSAGVEGGGMYVSGGSPNVVSNNTFSENSAPSGGGMYSAAPSFDVSFANVDNNIFAFSTQGEGIVCGPGTTTTMTCNDLFGNTGGDAMCGIDGGNNIFVDPEFCGALMSGLFDLQSDSPCASANNAACGLIGALPVNCGPVSTEHKSWGQLKAIYK